MLFDSGIMFVCMLGMFASQLLSPLFGFTVFVIMEMAWSIGMVITIVEMLQLTYSIDKYMLGEMKLPKLPVKLVEEAQRFKKDQKGIMWVWAVCLLTIVIMSIAWFTLSWPAFLILDAVLASYSFPPTARLAITLVSNVISWFLILMTLGLLLWAFVNSQRKEDVSYPY